MKTDNQREQLKGYNKAVQEMVGEIEDIQLSSSIAKVYFEKLELRMRAKVSRLVEEFDDE